MIPLPNLAMEPSSIPHSSTPLDQANHHPRISSISTTRSDASSPRIRRKPLPSTALSIHSIVSSPGSIQSDKEGLARTVVPPSIAALAEILDSPLESPEVYHSSSHPVPAEAVPQRPSELPRSQHSTGAVSFTDFPLPPQHNSLSQHRTNEDPNIPLTHPEEMATKIVERPPPLRMESLKAVKSHDAKKTQSPGGVFTSFFSRKPTASPQTVSPGAESSATDISDTRSNSPYPGFDENSYFSQQVPMVTSAHRHPASQSSQGSINYGALRRMNSGASGSIGPPSSDLTIRCNMLESELKDISRELAGSIRRELDLEDLVERLQSEAPPAPLSADRTSDYFSDSGTSSVRHPGSEYNAKEEVDKIKRESEQQRAQLKIDLSQKWQNEVSQRKNLESHIQILEDKLSRSRQNTNESSDASARIRELEMSLDDARRRLVEERQTKENFEDLLTALRVELEQHRNERDNLRDEVVPNLRIQIEGLESTFGDTQKQAYDYARMQQEIQSLRDENAALSSARKMEQEIMRTGMQYITEEGSDLSPRSSLAIPKSAGLNRSNTVSGRGPASRTSLSRSGSLSRSNSVLNRPLPTTPEALNDPLTALEQQRDALHIAVKYLRNRYDLQGKAHGKKIQALERRIRQLSNTSDSTRKGGYEREVGTLRQEINVLRKRADDALDQKWQCEKGLAGLKMDLDRSKQETASLQQLIQARDSDDPELLSAALENAMNDLHRTRAQGQETVAGVEHEQKIADQLEESAERAEALAIQVRKQLDANSSLRNRLKNAVEVGEQNQHTSTRQINQLQSKLKQLEDAITTTQLQSETAVMKHEEEIRNLKASHNAQLMRAKAGIKSPVLGQGQPSPAPMSPMFANRSPRLDQTRSGPGMALHQALKTEFLEKKVAELEKALRDAEREMEEVVGRMNTAQIGVFELQQERDEAFKRTRTLEAEVKAERARFQTLVDHNMN